MTEQETISAPIVDSKAAPDKEDAVRIANMNETDWKTMLAEMRIA